MGSPWKPKGIVDMSMIPSFFKNAVVAIGEDAADGKKRWFGSGFIVGRPVDADKKRANVYLITNRHVIGDRSEVQILLNKRGCAGSVALKCKLREGSAQYYSVHPDSNVDVVACQLNGGIVQSVSELTWFDLDENALTLDQMKANGVDEGCLVYAVGFPMGIVSDGIKAPFMRLGCISRIEDAFCRTGDGTYYVDAQTFPGNSGGPIISRPESVALAGTKHNEKASLIGILNSYQPYFDYLVSQQTGRPVMIHRENSGLTKVFPVDRIIETVSAESRRYAKLVMSRK